MGCLLMEWHQVMVLCHNDILNKDTELDRLLPVIPWGGKDSMALMDHHHQADGTVRGLLLECIHNVEAHL